MTNLQLMDCCGEGGNGDALQETSSSEVNDRALCRQRSALHCANTKQTFSIALISAAWSALRHSSLAFANTRLCSCSASAASWAIATCRSALRIVAWCTPSYMSCLAICFASFDGLLGIMPRPPTFLEIVGDFIAMCVERMEIVSTMRNNRSLQI